MTHFNIVDQNSIIIGNGTISNNHEVKITVIEYNGQQFANLCGIGSKSDFGIGFKGQDAIFIGKYLQSSYFNINNGNDLVGVARFLSSIDL